MSEQHEITEATRALWEAANAAKQAHWAVCTLGCSVNAIACRTYQRLFHAEEEAWWAAQSETLPPGPPVYTDPTSQKAVAR